MNRGMGGIERLIFSDGLAVARDNRELQRLRLIAKVEQGFDQPEAGQDTILLRFYDVIVRECSKLRQRRQPQHVVKRSQWCEIFDEHRSRFPSERGPGNGREMTATQDLLLVLSSPNYQNPRPRVRRPSLLRKIQALPSGKEHDWSRSRSL